MSNERKYVEEVNGEDDKDQSTRLNMEQGKIKNDADRSVDDDNLRLRNENTVNGGATGSTDDENKIDIQNGIAQSDILSGPTIHQACEEENSAAVKKELSRNPSCIDSKDCNGSCALHIASKKGLVDIVKVLLKHNADVNLQDACRQTPMHCAIIGGHLSVVVVLLDCRPRPDLGIRDQNGRSPLLCAINKEQVDIVKKLVTHPAYVNMRDGDGFAGLHLAVKKGSLEMVRELVKFGADVNIVDDDGLTALHWAVSDSESERERQIDIVKLLLCENADKNAEDEHGQSPLHWAVKCNFFESVRELLRRNSDPNAKDCDDRSPVHLAARDGDVKVLRELLEYRADIESRDQWGLSPLFYAISEGREEMVKELLTLKADSNTQSCLEVQKVSTAVKACSDDTISDPVDDDDGSDKSAPISDAHVSRIDALSRASVTIPRGVSLRQSLLFGNSGVRYPDDHGDRRDYEVFCGDDIVDSGAVTDDVYSSISNGLVNASSLTTRRRVDQKGRLDPKCHCTPLQLASFLGNIQIVEALLEHGAEASACDHSGFTALHWASKIGHVGIIKKLFKCNIDVNAKAIRNITPLHLAMEGGHCEAVLELLKSKADINAGDVSGSSPFFYAASRGQEKTMCAFLGMNPDYDVNEMNEKKGSNSGQTALHKASVNGYVSVVQVLLSKNAKTDLKNFKGNTALYLASGEGHLETVGTLLSRCNPNIKNGNSSEGETALQIAAEKGHTKVVKILLESGADPNISSGREERFPLIPALVAKNYEMAIMLIKHIDLNISAYRDGIKLPFFYWALKVQLQDNDNIVNFVRCLSEARNDTGFSILHWAVRAENVAVVKHLSTSDPSLLNLRDCHADTPLHLAVSGNNHDIVKELLKAGSDPNLKDVDGLTALYVAAWKGNFNCAIELCHCHETDPNIDDQCGLSPLHWAAKHGSVELVDALKRCGDCGADINKKSIDGLTPLYWAARNGHAKCVEALVSDEIDVKDEEGLTPLFWAVSEDHSDVVEVLTGTEYPVNIQVQYKGLSLLHVAVMKYGHNVKKSNSYDRDAKERYFDTIKLLIKSGVNVNFQDQVGETPLDYAIRAKRYPIIKELVAAALYSEAEMGQLNTINEMWVLHFLILEGDLDIAEFLADQKSLINTTSFHQHTLLQLSATLGDQRNFNSLLELEGTNIDHRNAVDQTSLHSTTHIGNDAIVKKLLRAGADPKRVDKFGMTALHLASAHGHCSLVQRFIDEGVNPSLTDMFGRTCLHLAVLYRRDDVVKQLLEQSVKRDLKDKRGNLPLDYLLQCEKSSLTFSELDRRPATLREVHVNEEDTSSNLITIEHAPNLKTLWETPGVGTVNCIENYNNSLFVNRIEKAVKKVTTEAIKLFTGSTVDLEVTGVGSAFEGTRVGLPNELDFLIKIDTFHFSSNPKMEGYLIVDEVTSITKQLKIMGSHGVWLWAVLMNYWCQCYTEAIDSDGASLSMPLPPQRHPDHKTCTTWLWSYSDDNFRDFPVSVDFVPAIKVSNSCQLPSKVKLEGLSQNEMCSFIVPKIPYENTQILASGQLKKEDVNKLGRQSFPTMELKYLQSLDKEYYRVKKVLITAKCLRKPEVCGFKVKTTKGELVPVNEFVTSYHLKTVFQHLIRTFQESNMSLGKMVLLIYEKLEMCLHKQNLPMFFKSESKDVVNVLVGSRLNREECAVVARQMVKLVRALYDRDYDQSEHGNDAVEMARACPWMPECFVTHEVASRSNEWKNRKNVLRDEWKSTGRFEQKKEFWHLTLDEISRIAQSSAY